MVWNALLPPTNAVSLALVTTTVDQVLVWGAVALVIGLIAWREYTLPEVALSLQASDVPGDSDPGATSHGAPLVSPDRVPGPESPL